MLYRVLHVLMHAAFRIYFGKITHRGLEAIDRGGPMLILANHTNSFMDAMLLAVLLKRRIHFFARGDAFGKPWADRILRSLGLLPVYRLKEGKELLGRNEESNDEALRILQGGGAVLIFAEGASHVAKVLKPLKKGPFRLAVRAAAILEEPLQIVPLGINFGKPEAPRTDAWIIGGEAFVVTAPEDNSEAAAARAALATMRETAVRLLPLVPDARSMDKADAADLLVEMARVEKGAALSFDEVHRIAAVVGAGNPDEKNGLLQTAAQYAEAHAAFHLSEKAFSRNSLTGGLLLTLLMAPMGIPGFLIHAAPFGLARLLVKRYVTDADFIAAVYVPLAVILVVIWYLLVILPLAFVLGGIYALLWLPAAAVAGLVAGRWLAPQLRILIAILHASSLRGKYPGHWTRFSALRQQLLAMIRW